jgi:YHS domain-containing protein
LVPGRLACFHAPSCPAAFHNATGTLLQNNESNFIPMKSLLIISSFALVFSACKKQESTASSAPSTAPAATSVKPYPLDTCLVSGEKLGEMGEPVVIVHEGQEIKFCCEKCQPKFEKDPAKYLSKLESPKP